MELEKNPRTRDIFRKLLQVGDRIFGVSFPGMKRVKQITPNHCGPAVLESLFSFIGIKVSQRSMVASIRAQNKIRQYGLGLKEMQKAASIYGKGKAIFWKKSNAKLSDLDQILNKYKFPIGVEWQGVFYEDEDEDNGHYSIITAFNKKKNSLRISDPYYKFFGIDRRFGVSFFEKRWWDTNQVGKKFITDKRVMFVITHKDATWPAKLGMKR